MNRAVRFKRKQRRGHIETDQTWGKFNMAQVFNISSNVSVPSNRGNFSRSKIDSEQAELLSTSLIVVLSFMCLLIVTVNGLVIFLIHKKKTLRTFTNMFLTSLAISDLLSGLVGIPLILICLVTDILPVCVASAIFIRFTAISSVCHVLLIAVDRYAFIVHFIKYRSIVTKRRSIIAVVVVWLISLVATVIQLSWYIFYETALTEYKEMTEKLNKLYSLACVILFFAMPLILMCYIYGRIFYISYQYIKNDRQLCATFQQPCRSLLHEWRGRSVLLITMVIFAGCWLPFFLAMLHDYMESSEQPAMAVWAQRLLVFLGFTPSMLNPILCTLAKKDFRRALKEVVLVDSKDHCERPVYLNALGT